DSGDETRRKRPQAVRAARICGSHRPEQQPFIEAAGAIPLQIEADETVPDGLQLADDRRCHLLVERARHLVARQLDARDLVVMADAEDAESEAAERLLGAFDGAQLLAGHLMMVGDPRRE